jgi:hypothetical protein
MNAAASSNDLRSVPLGRKYKSPAYVQAFAERLAAALDNNPNVPPLGRGRLGWIQQQFAKRGVTLTVASVNRWTLGTAVPEPDKIPLLADMLGTDAGWLQHGTNNALSPREARARNALANGAVNLVAGMIQMGGGSIAFPDEDDKAAIRDAVSLKAIIRGASYSFHVATGEERDGSLHFIIPRTEGALILAIVQREGFHFDVFEITADVVETHGTFTRGAVEVVAQEEDLRRITTFAERI